MNRIIDLDKLIEGYRIACLAEARQANTVAWYMQKLSYFKQYLVSTNHSLDITTIAPEDIRAFLTHLRTEVKKDALNPYKPAQTGQLSPLTVQGYARALKAFFSWLVRDEHIVANPMKFVKMPKAPKMIVVTLRDDQIRKLLAVIDQKNPLGYRDYCMVLILLDTGVRLSELVNLKIDDIDLERGQFKVMGKGWKERIVPFVTPLPVDWLSYGVVIVATALSCSGLGVLIGVISSNSRVTILWSQLIFLPSMMLGGMMVPTSMLPGSLARFSALLPASHSMQAFMGLAYQQETAWSPTLALAILLAGGVLSFVLSVYLFEWDSQNTHHRPKAAAILALAPYIAAALLVG